ncbi:hypothetical protein POVCU1_055340 [Plasmodium ovale curtisi]|uniref:Uncharacterized protein n=1 Tax=Plasmodium ovale curtisi TaxID=864141 RepID=A0A1A8X3K4_PLAOA|nr:hypothetical protein POVCU1_055340 [Plasmodium ovale curtisi]
MGDKCVACKCLRQKRNTARKKRCLFVIRSLGHIASTSKKVSRLTCSPHGFWIKGRQDWDMKACLPRCRKCGTDMSNRNEKDDEHTRDWKVGVRSIAANGDQGHVLGIGMFTMLQQGEGEGGTCKYTAFVYTLSIVHDEHSKLTIGSSTTFILKRFSHLQIRAESKHTLVFYLVEDKSRGMKKIAFRISSPPLVMPFV